MGKGASLTAGIALAVLALVALAALFEHFAGLKGDQWLENIFPFGLARSPAALSLIAAGGLLGAWLLLKTCRRG